MRGIAPCCRCAFTVQARGAARWPTLKPGKGCQAGAGHELRLLQHPRCSPWSWGDGSQRQGRCMLRAPTLENPNPNVAGGSVGHRAGGCICRPPPLPPARRPPSRTKTHSSTLFLCRIRRFACKRASGPAPGWPQGAALWRVRGALGLSCPGGGCCSWLPWPFCGVSPGQISGAGAGVGPRGDAASTTDRGGRCWRAA